MQHPAPSSPFAHLADPDVLDAARADAAAAGGELSADEVTVCNTVEADLQAAFRTMAPFRHRAKIAVFGSARLQENTVPYNQARDLCVMLARAGFVTVTGGGPGIMTAGLEGAGPGNAVGVAIELPFESPLRSVGVPVVMQRRFATRKIALMRRMRGFVCTAGGFGTLDELFEVLTLVQTGHKDPTPVVLLDDGTGLYDGVLATLERMRELGLVSADDGRLLAVVRTPQAAYDHICQFFRRYRGVITDADGHVLKLTTPLTDAEIDEFAAAGFPLAAHPRGGRVTERLDAGRLRVLIDELNLRSTEPLPPHLGLELSVTGDDTAP